MVLLTVFLKILPSCLQKTTVLFMISVLKNKYVYLDAIKKNWKKIHKTLNNIIPTW